MSEEIPDNVSETQDIQDIIPGDTADIQNNPPEIQEIDAALVEIPAAEASGENISGDAPSPPPVAPKRRGRPTGARNKPKIVAVPVDPPAEGGEEEEVEAVVPAPKAAAKRASKAMVAPPPSPALAPQAPPWAQHASAASYLEEQLRELKRQRQLAKYEMWGQLIQRHM